MQESRARILEEGTLSALIRDVRGKDTLGLRRISAEEKRAVASEALKITEGNKTEAAKLLRIGRDTFHAWIKIEQKKKGEEIANHSAQESRVNLQIPDQSKTRQWPKGCDFSIINEILFDALTSYLYEEKVPNKISELQGVSEEMKFIKRLAHVAAKTDDNVLITGAIGVGKTLLAQLIHQDGSRKEGHFFAEGIDRLTSFQTEMEKHSSPARGDTLFFDDIETFNLSQQDALLRILDQREMSKTGRTTSNYAKVRIIAAANHDLLYGAIADGMFREALVYKLGVLTIRIPKLSERREDIPLLLNHFIIRHRADSSAGSVDSEFLEFLENKRKLGGNLRELENITRYAILSYESEPVKDVERRDGILKMRHINGLVSIQDRLDSEAERLSNEGRPLDASGIDGKGRYTFKNLIASAKNAIILRALERSGGKVNEAARFLKVSRYTVHRFLKKYDMKPEDFRRKVD